MRNLKGELLIYDMHNQKPNYSALAREYGMDRRTIKKIHGGITTIKKKKRKVSKLDKYQEIIKEKLNIPGSNKKAVYEYIVMNIDDQIGSYSNFRKYTLKYKDILIPKKENVHPRFETEMGLQLQFDWKGPITLVNKLGIEFKFYVFSATLCASRLHVYCISEFMTRETVQRCLIRVFEYVGGVPKELLTDNMSSIINYSQAKFVPEFEAFCRDMGTIPKKCKVGSPETKGKDETCNKFVNWILPYNNEFETLEDLHVIMGKINEKVNREINQTTNMSPISLFRKEKEYLLPLPRKDILNKYLDNMIPAKVSNGCLVYYKGSEYSVPKKYINQTIKLEENDNKLFIYYNKDLIASHDISNKRIQYDENHYIEALKSSMPYKADDEIEQLAKKNLELLSRLTN